MGRIKLSNLGSNKTPRLKLNRRVLEKQAEEKEKTSLPVRLSTLPRTEALLNTVVPQVNMEGYVREISRLWGEAKEKFLAIGDYLLMAKSQLAHGEYEAMIQTKLPFGKSAAHRMRAVAEAVKSGRLPKDRLPHSYATAYELTLLSNQQLRVAEDRGLVHPNVHLSEIKSFRQETSGSTNVELDQEGALIQEWKLLGEKIEHLEAQLQRAAARRLEIESKIGHVIK
jgi:hypothetical protein